MLQRQRKTTDGAISDAFWRSWQSAEGIESLDAIEKWISQRNSALRVEIKRIDLNDCDPWLYDESLGQIRRPDGSFFQVAGLSLDRHTIPEYSGEAAVEQPIIIQNEIGFLGIICKDFDGVMHFLMQAKIEPGNVNKVQVSPTLQATRSNFTQKHGGGAPAFLDIFANIEQHYIVVDQIQSEQSSRFLGKRNRNVIILVEGDIDVPETHKWMTLGQIKQLMRKNNLVNMDTRTVLSCIPWPLWDQKELGLGKINDTALFNSIYAPPSPEMLYRAYGKLNDFRMHSQLHREIKRIDELDGWGGLPQSLQHQNGHSFSVIFCNISIEGREVRNWNQPLFKASGEALFGLLTRVKNGCREFLVQAKPEIGCFDSIEFGPTVQRDANDPTTFNIVEQVFLHLAQNKDSVACDVMLSEEGGRFYHEQNRNLIIHYEDPIPSELQDENLPSPYLWLNYKTIGIMLTGNNNINIQLRNLLSLLEI